MNTAMIYFLQEILSTEQNKYVQSKYIKIWGGAYVCRWFTKCNMLTLLPARTCGRPFQGCLHAL
jgi:hypothetical protein